MKLKSKSTKKNISIDGLWNKLNNRNQTRNKGNILTKINYKKYINILKYTIDKKMKTIDLNNNIHTERPENNSSDKNYLNIKINVNNSLNYKNGLTLSNYKQPKKKLAILKDGIIYWLRKLYIILQGININNININYKKNLYMNFYYPIKDVNLILKKDFSYKSEDKDDIFCKTLEDIIEGVKCFLKLPNFSENFKTDLYNEDCDLIKNDNQLMEKKEKYKLLYIKISKLSDEQKMKKLYRCKFHRHQRKCIDSNIKELDFPFYFFTNKEIQSKISLDTYFNSPSQNKFLINNKKKYINIENTENNKNENIYHYNNIIINRLMNNEKYFNNNTDKNILKEKENNSSFFLDIKNNNNKYKNICRNKINIDNHSFPKLILYKNNDVDLYGNNTCGVYSPLQKNNLNEFYKKYSIPRIKSKGLWNQKGIINKISKKNSIISGKKSERKLNIDYSSINDINYYKTMEDDSDNYINFVSNEESQNNNNEINNIKQNNINDEFSKYLKINNNNIINNKQNSFYNKRLNKKLMFNESVSDKDSCDDVFNYNYTNNLNEFLEKNSFIKINRNNNKNIKNNLFDKINNYKQINNIIEINQIQFITLNTCLREFISIKIDKFIDDEEIQKIFNKEQIFQSLKNINNDKQINIFLKEFLLYSYLSNYITKNYPQFCNDFYELLKDYYININNILSINKFNDFINDFKNIFHSIKTNKKIMIEKIKESNIKNNIKISWIFFVLFVIYNKKNLSTLFNKELLYNFLECIDIHLCKDITIEQFIKFKIYFIENKYIDIEMKKKIIINFFNNFFINNKNCDVDLSIIKLKSIIKITSEDIKRIENNKFYIDNNNVDKIYKKFLDYFNF